VWRAKRSVVFRFDGVSRQCPLEIRALWSLLSMFLVDWLDQIGLLSSGTTMHSCMFRLHFRYVSFTLFFLGTKGDYITEWSINVHISSVARL